MEALPSQIRLLKMWHGENYQLRVCPKAFKEKPATSSHYPKEYKACKQECKDLNPVWRMQSSHIVGRYLSSDIDVDCGLLGGRQHVLAIRTVHVSYRLLVSLSTTWREVESLPAG